jgi:hypothetical protein
MLAAFLAHDPDFCVATKNHGRDNFLAAFDV